jgi:hypothetical protein
MNNTYINIRITYYSHKYITPTVCYYRADHKSKPVFTHNKLTVDEANQLMWELVKLGGKNRYSSNPYRAGISTREVSFYGQL